MNALQAVVSVCVSVLLVLHLHRHTEPSGVARAMGITTGSVDE